MIFSRLSFLFWFGTIMFGMGCSLQAQTLELEKDERLKNPVRIEAFCVDMATLCKRLSDSKLVLSPSAECRDQKLQLRITDQSRLAVMKALAEWLPGKWESLPDQRGYILSYTPQSLKRRKEWWDTLQNVRDEVAAYSSAKLLENVRLTPAQRPTQFTPSPDDNGSRATSNQIRAFFNTLPDALYKELIAQNRNMTDYQLEPYHNTQDESNSINLLYSDLPEPTRAFFRGKPNDLPGDTRLQFTYANNKITANFFSPAGKYVYSTMSLNVAENYPQLFTGLDHTHLGNFVKFAEAKNETIPPNWLKLIAYQNKTFWKNALPNPEERMPATPPIPRAFALDSLAASGRFDFLSDYYSTPGLHPPRSKDKSPIKNLEKELNLLAGKHDSSWKKQGDLYLVRHNRWYRNDLLEIPHTLAKQFLMTKQKDANAAQSGTLPKAVPIWRRMAHYADQLTLWQIGNGLKYLTWHELDKTQSGNGSDFEQQTAAMPPLIDEAGYTLTTYDTLRFSITLPEAAQSALEKGEMRLEMLTPMQQQTLMTLLPAAYYRMKFSPLAIATFAIDWKGELMFGGWVGIVCNVRTFNP